MLVFCLVGALCGVVLGARFQVMALVPFLAMVLAVMVLSVAFGGLPPGQAALLYIGLACSLQAAYLGTVAVCSMSGLSMRPTVSKA